MQAPGHKERFTPHKPMSKEELAKAVIPIATQKKAAWATNTYEEWREFKRRVSGEYFPPLQDIAKEQIQDVLSAFIREARKQDGSKYPPSTLH